MSGGTREEADREWLIARLAELTGQRIGDLDRPLREFGLSSRDTTALAAEIGERLGVELPSTLVWGAPTAEELLATLRGDAPRAVPLADLATTGGPVAVVGLACRFPGASTVDEFWAMLSGGGQGVGEVPRRRWAAHADQLAHHGLPRSGGFLDDAGAFDAEYFGVEVRQAELMDPQQRLLLEVGVEALAHAGIPPESLRGADCGVYVGLSATEWGALSMVDIDRVDAWSSTGAAGALAANRLSYVLGTHGPSVTIDTACSASLVAVHAAMRALMSGDVPVALAGGVNVLVTPGITASFQRAGVLASDGRCKPFDAAADGIVRGEGCGVVVLKRLADAERDGDRVLAVLRGGEVNSDGRSNGVMAPNPVAQQRLLTQVYARTGLPARTVDYVEAHGTGTSLGDAIESGALAAVLGAGRPTGRPLLIGSVKANLGHLEGAAGIAGLIKVVLSLWHGTIPPTPNVTSASPGLGETLNVVTTPTDWPRYSGVARAGVSSFGFGGTNSHLVLEEAPAPTLPRAPSQARTEVVALAARTPARLRARAAAVADWLDDRVPLPDVASALLWGSDQSGLRAAVPARDHADLRARLRALAADRPDAVAVGEPVAGAEPVFVFSGFGSGWPGMGKRLLAEEPAFAEIVAELDVVFRDAAGVDLSALLAGGHGEADALSARQLALFGAQVALARLWREHGVTPAAVVGASMGEVAAAVVAGALPVEDGLLVMLRRTDLLDELDGERGGAMAAVELSDAEWAEISGSFPGLSVAVHASPHQRTVTGPADQVAALVSTVESQGRMARLLPVRLAGHSPAVDRLLGRFTAGLRAGKGITPGIPDVPCYSTVLDDGEPEFDVDYWAANLRRPVRLGPALTAALADGHRVFVEIAPHPIASVAVEQCAAALGVSDVRYVPTMRRDLDGSDDGFAAALAALHVHGHRDVLRRRYPHRVVLDPPATVWEHRDYWLPARTGRRRHPLLGERVEVPEGERFLWPCAIDPVTEPWLAGHVLHGVEVLSAGTVLELLLAAVSDLSDHRPVELGDVVLPDVLPVGVDVSVSASVPARAAEPTVAVHGRAGDRRFTAARATVTRTAGPPRPLDGRVIDVHAPSGPSGVVAHPELLDTCLNALGHRPSRLGRVVVNGNPRAAVRAVVGESEVRLLDEHGTVLVELAEVVTAPVSRADVPHLPEHLAYETVWEPSPRQAGRRVAGNWLLLPAGQAEEQARAVAAGLGEAGGVVRTRPLSTCDELGELDARDLAGVVVLAGPPGPVADVAAARSLVLASAKVAALVAESPDPARLWLVTTEAAAVTGEETGAPGGSALRGLVRVLAYEHPELRASWVDLDDATALVDELLADPADDEVALRGEHRHAHRLRRAELPAAGTARTVRDGAYLITGGLGGLGLAAARWLADRGATRVVLSSRRPADAATLATIEEICGGGTEIAVVTGDVADAGVARRLVATATSGGLALRGVLHAAGVLSDAAVMSLRASDIEATWRAKTEGALRLHEACADHRLDWWLAYSSAAALFGSPGQAAYATANAWLDAFVHWRRSAGYPTATVQWGAWARIGGAAGRDNPVLEPMPPAEGMAALDAVLASARERTGVSRLDTGAVLALFPALADRPFFAAVTAGPDRAERRDPAAMRAMLLDGPEPAREHLRGVLAEMLWRDPKLIDPDVPLTALGLDSLLAMRARGAIERDFATTVPLTLLLRGATLTEVAEHLAGTVTQHAPANSTGPAPRDHAERWIARLCHEVLGLPEDTAVHTPIHDSVARERLSAAVSAELGVTVDLFATPTVAGMADAVRDDLTGPDTGPVRGLGGDGGPPLFLFHAAGSTTAVYRPLAERLPVTCLGLERLADATTVEEKVETYVSLLRQHQPGGPYRIGGWSFGGLLAFETARRLTAAGDEVELLVLVDTILPLPDEPDTVDPGRLRLRRFVEYIERTYELDLGLGEPELAGLSEDELSPLVLTRLAERVTGMGDAVLAHQQTSYVDARIAEHYRPGPYAGPVLLFRAKDPHPLTTTLDPRYLRTDDALGWDEHCADLEVVRVDGDHITVIDPPRVDVVAERISARLRQLDGPRRKETRSP